MCKQLHCEIVLFFLKKNCEGSQNSVDTQIPLKLRMQYITSSNWTILPQRSLL